jgi:hypothetical protein
MPRELHRIPARETFLLPLETITGASGGLDDTVGHPIESLYYSRTRIREYPGEHKKLFPYPSYSLKRGELHVKVMFGNTKNYSLVRVRLYTTTNF